MNIIIIAACIPTLRPLCLVLFRRPEGDAYRLSPSKHKRSSYYKTPASNDSSEASQSSQVKDVKDVKGVGVGD